MTEAETGNNGSNQTNSTWALCRTAAGLNGDLQTPEICQSYKCLKNPSIPAPGPSQRRHVGTVQNKCFLNGRSP